MEESPKKDFLGRESLSHSTLHYFLGDVDLPLFGLFISSRTLAFLSSSYPAVLLLKP